MKKSIVFALLTTVCAWSHAQELWTLQKCIDYAFQQNIQIQQSELNLASAGINRQQNIGQMLPSLNASGTHGYNWGQTIDPFTNQFASNRIRSNSLGISTSMTIFNGFQNLNSVKQSSVDFQVAQANLEKMRNDIALNVANAFLNVLFQEELLKIARSNVDNTSKQAARIADLVTAGAAAQSAFLDIQSQLATDEASLVQAENNLNLANLALRQLLRIPSSEAANFAIASPNLEDFSGVKLAANAEVAIAHALTAFPEIKSAEANVKRSAIGVNVARGGMSPRLGMSFSYGSGYSGANQVPIGDPILGGSTPIGFVESTGDVVVVPTVSYADYETKAFGDQLRDNVNRSLFFQLSIPIFNGFANKSNIERAQVAMKSAELNLEQTQLQLRQSVETAYADAEAAEKTYAAAEKNVEAARLSMDFAEVRYQEGASNFVDYTAARVRYDNARANLIRSKYDYIFKVKVVEFYMGQPISLR